MQLQAPIAKDLVLLGGGHSHVVAISHLAPKLASGDQIMLIE